MAFSRTSEQALLAIGIVASAVAATAIPVIVGRYQPLFASAGIALPNLTRWFVQGAYGALLLPALVALVWMLWPVRSARGVAAFTVGVGSLVVFVPLAMLAMQFPMMMLGAGG